MAEYRLTSSQLKEYAPQLNCGDRVLLSGTVYTARDAAHKRIVAMMADKQPLPFEIDGASIYYAGPTPAPEGLPIGSCGPTTSSRMDPYAPLLLDNGLVAMIGKGPRNREVVDALVRNKAVYLCAIGGAGALAAQCITSCEVIAFEDLGCESVKRLEFCDFPLIVGIDSQGGSLFS
ncbi:MAG: FumA C-terminus/TtdB family hydratase beta subunit [Acutalibacteraceae bacterium]|nr:FumA C-terminus/TtdB family hydratase beta subunit [Acutalibacteraceae bacterium]